MSRAIPPVKIRLLSVGTRQPSWVKEGYDTYAKRMPRETTLVLDEIPAPARKGSDRARWIHDEGVALLQRIKPGERVIALDEIGRQLATADLAEEMSRWRDDGRDVVLVVGGADGLSDECRQRADWLWSLSAGTLPHGLVRIVVAEQLYRAWTVLTGHPYHRA